MEEKRKELSDFAGKVLAAVQQVPRGRVVTYGRLARFLGRPGAARAVGSALGKNPWLEKVPCHRVVCANGFLGGYAAGARRKKELLESEGIKVANGKVKDFYSVLFYL